MHIQRETRVGVIVSALLLVPLVAWGMSSTTGVARDTSGGILPGVTVEAASPVLIEKVRSVVTDVSGVYRIGDLRPGTSRIRAGLDVYNGLNASNVLSMNTTYGTTGWLDIRQILGGRLMRVGAQLDF